MDWMKALRRHDDEDVTGRHLDDETPVDGVESESSGHGRRVALDQHEILDILYTEETDRLAKKWAKQAEREAKAAAKVPRVRRTKRRPEEPVEVDESGPVQSWAQRLRPVAYVAAVVAAVVGLLFVAGVPLTPGDRANREACEKALAVLPALSGEVESAQVSVAASELAALSRYKMDEDIRVEVVRASKAMAEWADALEDDPSAQDGLMGVFSGMAPLVGKCEPYIG